MQGGWTILGIAWGIAAYQLNTPYFLWLTPVFAGLVLSIPLTVMLSRTSVGRGARHRGLFLIGEELHPPRELHTLRSALKRTRSDGFIGAIVDPYVNALHLTLLKRTRGRAKPGSESVRAKLLEQGAEALTRVEKLQILKDASAVSDLHMTLWSGASKASPQPA